MTTIEAPTVAVLNRLLIAGERHHKNNADLDHAEMPPDFLMIGIDYEAIISRAFDAEALEADAVHIHQWATRTTGWICESIACDARVDSDRGPVPHCNSIICTHSESPTTE